MSNQTAQSSAPSASRCYRAVRRGLSVFIEREKTLFDVEVDWLAFPRFSGGYCSYETLDKDQQERLDDMLRRATLAAESLGVATTEADVRRAYREAR